LSSFRFVRTEWFFFGSADEAKSLSLYGGIFFCVWPTCARGASTSCCKNFPLVPGAPAAAEPKSARERAFGSLRRIMHHRVRNGQLEAGEAWERLVWLKHAVLKVVFILWRVRCCNTIWLQDHLCLSVIAIALDGRGAHSRSTYSSVDDARLE
ncbi:unnamed protein product, partial [Hapterophycus canaliculatus]